MSVLYVNSAGRVIGSVVLHSPIRKPSRLQLTRPTSFERWEGDGSWADAATDASFTVTVTLRGPAGQTADVVERRWRLADAVGGPLYERVSF